MIDVISVYMDTMDAVAEEQNGQVGFARFNRYSRLGELSLMDYLSGDISGIVPPEPYLTVKNMDYLSPIVTTAGGQTVAGKMQKPEDYYLYGKLAMGSSYRDDLCADPVVITGDHTPIELVESAEFDDRNNSFIEGVKPTIKNPIAKMVGGEFHFSPKDLGVILLEYKKYPVFGFVGSRVDPEFMEEVADPSTSVNYVWDEGCRRLLVWFICQQYPVRTRENALVQQLQAIGKSPRG